MSILDDETCPRCQSPLTFDYGDEKDAHCSWIGCSYRVSFWLLRHFQEDPELRKRCYQWMGQ